MEFEFEFDGSVITEPSVAMKSIEEGNVKSVLSASNLD